MKRTFREGSLRGNIKWRLKGIRFGGDSTLLTEEEREKLNTIKETLESILAEFDKNTAKLGFNVWRYDVVINKINRYEYLYGISTSEFKWYKKQNLVVTVLNKYKL
jgi:hypothetical protein